MRTRGRARAGNSTPRMNPGQRAFLPARGGMRFPGTGSCSISRDFARLPEASVGGFRPGPASIPRAFRSAAGRAGMARYVSRITFVGESQPRFLSREPQYLASRRLGDGDGLKMRIHLSIYPWPGPQSTAQCPITSVQCPMSNNQCPMPNAQLPSVKFEVAGASPLRAPGVSRPEP